MDKGITSVIELYQTLSQRPSLKTLQEKWLSIIFSEDQHSVWKGEKKIKRVKWGVTLPPSQWGFLPLLPVSGFTRESFFRKKELHIDSEGLQLCIHVFDFVLFCFVYLCVLVAVTLFPPPAFGQPFVLFWHGKNLVFSLGDWGSVLYRVRFLTQWHC